MSIEFDPENIVGMDAFTDIAAEAALIRNSAERVTAAALARRQRMDEEGRSSEPLYILAGETHTRPAHFAHHLALLDEIRATAPETALVNEFPYNEGRRWLAAIFRERTAQSIPSAALDELTEQDCHSALTLKMLSFQPSTDMAPHSHDVFYRALLRREIPVRMGDTACILTNDRRSFLDHRDRETMASAYACLNKKPVAIDTKTAEGMHVRNFHALRQADSFARGTAARIVIISSGNAHIMGYKGSDGPECPFPYSLAALCRAQGKQFLALPILCDNFRRASIPPGHELADQEWALIEDLPDYDAEYDPDGKGWNPSAFFIDRAGEAEYINGLLAHMGMQDDILGAGHAFRRMRAESRMDVEDIIDHVAQKQAGVAVAAVRRSPA